VCFTDGTVPPLPDFTWMESLGLVGQVTSAGRGTLAGGAMTGRDSRSPYLVVLSNDTAQYWADAAASDGSFRITGIKPGTYSFKVYKSELSVYSSTVTITAGQTSTLPSLALTGDPAVRVPLWRIGEWDGTVREFLNGDLITLMHPSDSRMHPWDPADYIIGTSTPAVDMPAVHFTGVNGTRSIQFTLNAAQIVGYTVRIGITGAGSGGRPKITMNTWTSSTLPSASTQPDSRIFTLGTYRGNNAMYSTSVPSSAFVVGTNTLSFSPISGSGGTGFLGPCYGIDCIDMYVSGSASLAVPGALAGLTATPSTGAVALTWSATAGASSYIIQRATVSGGPYQTVAPSHIPNSYTDTTVSPGTTYYYVVKSLNSSGAGPASTEVIAAVPGTFGPVAQLSFNEASGTTAADSTGHGWTGTLVGGPTFSAGKISNAVNFSGTAQYATLPSGVVSSLNDFTIASWVKTNATTAWTRVFDFGSGESHWMYLTASSHSGRPRFVIRSNIVPEQLIESSVAIPVGVWTHIAVSLTGTTGTLYINGQPVGTSQTITLRPSDLGLTTQNYLGKSQNAADPTLNGSLDDFRIYSRGLTGAEIYALWGGGSTNVAPTFTAKPTLFPAINQGVAYAQSLATTATDANGGTLTFTKLSGPAWLTVAANGTLSGTPGQADIGVNQFALRVTDAAGATDNTDLRLTVNNVNDAPTWFSTSFTREPVTSGQSYTGTSLAMMGDDVDRPLGDTISFSKASGPTWLSLSTTGILTGTPTAANAGTNPFVARLTDASGLTADATFTIQVVLPALQLPYSFDGANGNIPGVFGQARSFDGSTTSISLGALPGTLYKDFTASAWVWPNSTADFQRIFDFGSGTDEYLTLMLVGSALRFQIVENGITQTLNGPVVPLGQWAHLAVTLSGSTATLYVNGTSVATSTTMTDEPSDIVWTETFLGQSQFTADPLFSGKMDDFRLYNYGLTAAEVAAMVSAAPSLPPAALFAGASGTRVTLTWPPVPNATSYTIKRSTTSGGPYSTVATGVTAKTYADTTGLTGTTYFYVITATSTAGESAISNEVSAVISDFIAWLKFDETTGTLADDSSGNAWDGTLISTPTWTPGLLRNAVSLSGTLQHLTLPGGIVGGLNDFTIATWIKVPAFTTFGRVFDFGTGTTNYMFLSPQSTTTVPNAAKMRFAIRTPAVTEQQINSTVALTAGTWAHVAVTLTGSTGRLFINGTQVGINAAMTLKPSSLGATTLNYLGRSQFTADPYLNASLDDFRLYGRALSAAELTTLAQPVPEAPETVTIITDDAQAHLSWTAPSGAGTYTVKRSLNSSGPYSVITSGLTTTSFNDTLLTNDVTYFYLITSTNTWGEGPPSAAVAVTPTALRVYYKFDETTGTVAADSSGRGIDGTLLNGPTFAAGKIDNALVFDGTNDAMTVPAGVADTSQLTVAAWVWWNGGAASQRVYSFGDDTANYFNLSPKASAGFVKFGIKVGGGTEQALLAITALPIGSWQHIAVTLGSGTGKLYLNGLLTVTAAITNTPADFTPSVNSIGDSLVTTDPSFAGKVDDFRLYSRVLTATEVFALQAPTPYAAWQQPYFTPAQLADPTLSDPDADANNDGFSNLLAYAFNTSPWSNLTSTLPTTAVQSGYLTTTYTRRKAPSDVTYSVEVTDTLTTWQPATTQLNVSSPDATTERVTLRDNVPMSGAAKRFIRVRVVR
jgi:fibronectin type 3 domain-containing protein